MRRLFLHQWWTFTVQSRAGACGCDLAGEGEAGRIQMVREWVGGPRASAQPPPSWAQGRAIHLHRLRRWRTSRACTEPSTVQSTGGGGLRRRRKTEGVLCHFALDGGSAALREVFDVLVQGQHAVQTSEDLIHRSRPARRVFVVSHDEHIGKSCDLAGSLVDGLLDAVFGRGDLAFEAHAAVGAGFEGASRSGVARSSNRLVMKKRVTSRSCATGSRGTRMRKRVSSSWNMGGVCCQLRGRWNLAGSIPHVSRPGS